MTRRSLVMCLVFAGVAPLSTGCYGWRSYTCSGGGCYSNGLTPPGANTAGYYGPILNRPVLNRPVINRPVLNRPVFFPGVGAAYDGAPIYADSMAMGGDLGQPGCASCYSSPTPSAPIAMNGTGYSAGAVIASTGQPVPMLNYGSLPADFTVTPPPFTGSPTNVLPQPKVYPSGEATPPMPMPTTGSK